MSNTLAATDFLAEPAETLAPVCVVFGDEPFLHRMVLAEIRHRELGDDDGQLSLVTFDGPKAEWRDVIDELSTLSLFGTGRRLVMVEDADSFVSRNRPALEKYVERPQRGGLLLLDVSTWASNTRLYKLVAQHGLQIECKTPAAAALRKWLIGWCQRKHGRQLATEAADLLLELIGPELGLLDQELAKLAAAAGGADNPITADAVDQLVGTWRTKTAWEMLDLALEGKAGPALVQLDRLLAAGESPIGLLAQMGTSLRRFAACVRLIEQEEARGRRPAIKTLLEQAGFRPAPFIINKAEQQLRQIGRIRAGRLLHELLEADLALKGASSAPERARFVLEQLVARLSRAAAPAAR